MNRFKAFIIKEFRHLLRDYRTVLIIFGIPIVQLLLFGHVITTEINNVRIAVFDHSKDDITTGIINKLASSGYFLIKAEVNSNSEIEKLFRKGLIKEVVVFEKDFGKKLISEGNAVLQIITDASEPNAAGIIEHYTRAIISDYITGEEISMQAFHIDVEHRMYFNEELRSANMFVPGTIVMILMLISALMTSISIAREKEMGTMEVLLVSPLRPIQIILGKVVPYLALSFLIAIIIISVGFFIFHVPVRGSVLLLLLLCFLFILLALSLGITISTVVKTQQAAMLISLVGLMLPTILLSGFIFPIENMPKILQYLSIIMPPRWFLTALKSVMLKGVGIAYIWKEMLILTGMLVVFIAISVKKFQVRLS